MTGLTHQRCFNHAGREAVARCLGCRQYFCRECVTEHNDRVLCAVCLQKLTKPAAVKSRALIVMARMTECLAGVLILWFFFYLIGEGLLAIPSSFHEGTLWHVNWMDKE